MPVYTTDELPVPTDPLSEASGRTAAINLRNKYQVDLDNAYANAVNAVQHVQHRVPEYQESVAGRASTSIKSHHAERIQLYTQLAKILGETAKFSSDAQGDDLIDSVLTFLRQRKELQKNEHVKRMIRLIEQSEKVIKKDQMDISKREGKTNEIQSQIAADALKAEQRLAAYDKVFNEWKLKISTTPYYTSKDFLKLPQHQRIQLQPNTVQHDTTKLKRDLATAKSQLGI